MIITLPNGKTIESDEFYRMSAHEQRALIQWNTPELRAKLEEARKTQYTPEVREKHSEKMKEIMSTPERREQLKKNSRDLWQDPEYVKRQMRRRQSQEYKNNHKKAVRNATRTVTVQPVQAPDGTVYDSIAQAARSIGKDPSTIQTWCNKPNLDWTKLPKKVITHKPTDKAKPNADLR